MVDFADRMSSDNDEFSFFICRRKGCHHVARSNDWLNNTAIGCGRYWCPECVEVYGAGQQLSPEYYCRASKILVHQRYNARIQASDLGDQVVFMDDHTADDSMAVPPEQAEPWAGPTDESDLEKYDIQPFIWMDTPLQQLENKFKVVGSDMLTDLRHIKEPMKRFEYIRAKADLAVVPSCF